MLPLIALTQTDIDRIVDQVPGGLANVQDIYALAPLQEGILFHHMLSTEGDPYLQTARLAFDSRARLDAWLMPCNRSSSGMTSCAPPSSTSPEHARSSGLARGARDDHGDLARSGAWSRHRTTRSPVRRALQRLSLAQAPLLRLTIAQEPGSGRLLALLVCIT